METRNSKHGRLMSKSERFSMTQPAQTTRSSQNTGHVSQSPHPQSPHLATSPEGLVLTDGSMNLRADFTRLLPRIHATNMHQELIVKAVKIKGVPTSNLLVVDATAGLGEDSFLLAAAGFRVVMFERDEIMAALLEDGLAQAAQNEQLYAITERITLRKEDSICALTSHNIQPDIVVLDPMFPTRSKSAAVKKKFQLIHGLEEPCTNEQELLNAAQAAHPRKIVIKRPAKGPWLAGCKPCYSLMGKSVRFDCLTFAPTSLAST